MAVYYSVCNEDAIEPLVIVRQFLNSQTTLIEVGLAREVIDQKLRTRVQVICPPVFHHGEASNGLFGIAF